MKSKMRYQMRHGFTLVEILLALTISSIIILGTNAAYQQAFKVWSSIESRRPIYDNARIITETLRQETSCLYIPPVPKDQQEEGQQDSTMFRVSNIPGHGCELTFYTHTPSWNETLESSRIARVSYRFTREQGTNTNQLIRTEEPCGGDKIIGIARTDIISSDISEFKVSVIDPNSGAGGNSWKESYESKDMPPKAVKVSLKWAETDKAPETEFESCIYVSTSSSVL